MPIFFCKSFKKLTLQRKDVDAFLCPSLERLRFTFTPNGKRQIQVENFSE